MAQITWKFQDEVVDIPNRYIATNVETGEQVTFDLLRGGKVSVVGTPLNAEKLNSLITAINERQEASKFATLTFTNEVSVGKHIFEEVMVSTRDWAGLYWVRSDYGDFFIFVPYTLVGSPVSSKIIGDVKKTIPAGTELSYTSSNRVIKICDIGNLV